MATATATQTNGTSILDEVSSKAPAGTVLPPRNIRELIEKTAGYVARNGPAFEERIRSSQGSGGKVTFIAEEDAYNGYYRWRVEEIREGRGTSISAGRKEGEDVGVSGKGREERKGPEKPEEFAFSARMPNISAQDLEVVRLTALFVAKNGRSWMTALSQKEAGNFQFDFLRPQHSLYQFFSRLVDQYSDLILGDNLDAGRPQKKRMLDLESNIADRGRVLERARKRAEWVKYQEAQKQEQEEKNENEKIAYAQIDWHDFVVVETVVFDDQDENEELPAPTSLNDIQSLSLEQKGLLSVGSDRRLEEAMPSFDDYEQFYDQAPEVPAAQVQPAYPPQAQQQTFQPPPDDETTRLASLQADRARARAAQEAAKNHPNQVKIRKDYIPAAQARNQTAHSGKSICPNCHQSIANEEMANHLKIEMLHPDWRDQYKLNQHRSSTTNLSTADVAANLKRLASQRTDVFDPVTGELVVSEEERERRRRLEQRAYDGVSGMPNSAALSGMGGFGSLGGGGVQGMQQQQGGVGGSGSGSGVTGENVDVQEQIRLIHERARNG